MRLSILTNDPGYSPDAFKEGVKVLLDGAEVTGVVSANEEDGWIRCYLERSEETYVRRGKVEIVQSGFSSSDEPDDWEKRIQDKEVAIQEQIRDDVPSSAWDRR